MDFFTRITLLTGLVFAALLQSAAGTEVGQRAFTPQALPIPISQAPCSAIVDFDGDGDPDLGIAASLDSMYAARIYRNDREAFPQVDSSLPTSSSSMLTWYDFDNDGDLDLTVPACASGFYGKITIRQNNGEAGFSEVGIVRSYPNTTYRVYVAWGDYDNDGDADLLVVSSMETALYRNDGGSFTRIDVSLPALQDGCAAWGDYDNDGDLDIALSGRIGATYTRMSAIYRNDGGAFTDIGAGIPAVFMSAMAWGDFDCDGDLDLAIAGSDAQAQMGYYTAITRIYRNDSGIFVDNGDSLLGVMATSLAWGDCDNDGQLDLWVAGTTGTWPSNPVSRIYRNSNGSFNEVMAEFPDIPMCPVHFLISTTMETSTSCCWDPLGTPFTLMMLARPMPRHLPRPGCVPSPRASAPRSPGRPRPTIPLRRLGSPIT